MVAHHPCIALDPILLHACRGGGNVLPIITTSKMLSLTSVILTCIVHGVRLEVCSAGLCADLYIGLSLHADVLINDCKLGKSAAVHSHII